MKASILEPHGAGDTNLGKRKAVSLSQESLVRAENLEAGALLPLVISPALDGVSLLAWAVANKEVIQQELLEHGAILFRGFGACVPSDFEQFVRAVAGDMLEYVERSSPRHPVIGNIYTSTDYPADQSIFLHNENSYQRAWPLKIFFMCQTPAKKGGQTPIADVRKVLGRIDPAARERFREKGVMYVRNFRDGLGLSWKAVFQTADRSVVDDYCQKNQIETTWLPGNRLRTRQYGQAIIAHPKTGEEVWFNHAAFFHISTLDPEIGEMLMEALGEDELPNNTYYGDGTRIEPDALESIRNAYRKETVIFDWQSGDILMLDNMLTAHGRTAYEGERKILVGMGEAFSRTNSER